MLSKGGAWLQGVGRPGGAEPSEPLIFEIAGCDSRQRSSLSSSLTTPAEEAGLGPFGTLPLDPGPRRMRQRLSNGDSYARFWGSLQFSLPESCLLKAVVKQLDGEKTLLGNNYKGSRAAR